MRTIDLTSIALGLVVAGSALAHDLYIMPERFRVSVGETLTVALHNGDAFPESENSAPLERLRDATLRSNTQAAPVQNLRVDGNRTLGSVPVPGSGALLLTVRTIPNFIELEADKFVAYLKEEGLSEVLDWRTTHGETAKPGRERYSKYAKSLLSAGSANEFYQTATGQLLEIVPEKDPSRLKPGDALPVRVLFRGSPAPNLQIETSWAGPKGKAVRAAGRTDANGRITVPLAQAGKWRLHTIKMERCSDPKAADWESFWSSLTFELR
ncbi:MAG: DUF4198 domain-containing protein [Candidatus Solibacter sp.]|nr:DUF4198 domain-containing protein [Candidatus Solibacter sp.]